MTEKNKTLSKKHPDGITTLKLTVKNLNRINSLLPRIVTHDQFIEYVLDCIDGSILVTKENVLMLGVKVE